MPELKERIAGIPQQADQTLSDYRSLFLSGCALLDVRAPVEFAKGSFPHAVNLPLMSDEERHLVGIRYKEQGQDSAIELGAELVTAEVQAERVALWMRFVEQNPHAKLYCFRGGLRSRIAQHWLQAAEVNIPIVKGGYKAMRSYLINELERLCANLAICLIGGRTGNGKTLLLNKLGATVDLEGLAKHRGSSFGSLPCVQPSNIDFENATTIELIRLQEAGKTQVFLEDEARLIGRVCLPETLRQAMNNAPIYILECDMPTRVQHCFTDYVTNLLAQYEATSGTEEGFNKYAEHHRRSLARIQKRFGSDNYQRALGLLNDALGQHQLHDNIDGYAEFIELLLRDYYDPMYDYQLSKKQERVIFRGTAEQIVEQSGTLK